MGMDLQLFCFQPTYGRASVHPYHQTRLAMHLLHALHGHMPFVEMAAPSGLVTTAAAIRSSFKTLARPNRVAMTIGLMESRPNPTEYKFAYNGFLGPDLSTTSWVDLNVFEMEGGSLGKPESLRVPGEGAYGQ
jgi:hypothetical protein